MHIIIAAQIFENSNELPEGVTAVAAWKANQILCTEIVDIVLIAGCTMQALCRDSLQSPGMLAQHTQQLLERREIEKEECCVCFEPFYANFFKFKQSQNIFNKYIFVPQKILYVEGQKEEYIL